MPQFHAVTVSNRGGSHTGEVVSSLAWSGPLASPGDAVRRGRELLDAGLATVAFVVCREDDGRLRPLPSYTRPKPLARVVVHWLELVDECGGHTRHD